MPNGKVLVVDDQSVFRESLKEHFLRLGFETVTAPTGKTALVKAREHKPNLILLDVMLPDVDGLEICQQLRREFRSTEISIILMSPLKIDRHIQRGIEVGATDFMLKPLSLEDIKSLVSCYLGKTRSDAKEAASEKSIEI